MKEHFLSLSRKMSYFQTQVFLILIYIFILCPIAILWKILRKDPLNKAWKKSEKSYMIKVEKENSMNQFLEKPY